jgi:signal transduction histidine kinase
VTYHAGGRLRLSGGPDISSDASLFMLFAILLSITTLFSRKLPISLACFLFRAVLASFVGLLTGSQPILSVLLLSALMLDMSISSAFPVNLLSSLAALATWFSIHALFAPLGGAETAVPGGQLAGIVLAPLGVILATAVVRGLLDRLVTERRQNRLLDAAVAQLIDANSGFLDFATMAEQRSTEEERKRITRELHDIVGQAFTNITAMMDAVIKRPLEDAEGTGQLYQWVRDQAAKGLQESRAVLYRLRSTVGNQVLGIHALLSLVKTFGQATGVAVTVEWGDIPWSLGESLDRELYRTLQESLINAFRHGKATRIMVMFRMGVREVHLLIRDNGSGGPTSKMGLGQHGIEERISMLGGTVEFENTIQGYTVRASFPVHVGP